MNDPVQSITSAPQKHSEEQRSRMIRYAVSMGIRVVCFVLAVLVQNWLAWIFLTLAVILPYIAVTLANAGGDRYLRQGEAMPGQAPEQLTTGADAAGAEREPLQWWEDEPEDDQLTPTGWDEPIAGEIVRDAPPEAHHPNSHRPKSHHPNSHHPDGARSEDDRRPPSVS